ncbi:hypothetical protein LEP1GSC158_1654 [Leptospira interrogans serovar Zanoni str. LT2156]|uniref:Uncharacterized protein n=1 Tax=Leptospira interrogans serovar Zanoni str. LT2156 TaxID=1001601 RepID=M6HCE0_LEPIR|nr:hypothetical protein LEP1GSC158_1654 [Leptospira interrogans serovar Zanoni str. LT2156]
MLNCAQGALAMIQYQIEWFYLEEYFGKVSDSREPLDAEK